MAGLPNSEARKFKNIACSNTLTALQMADALVDDLLLLEEGVLVYDHAMQQKAIAISPVLCVLCDNARASELVSSRANFFCRIYVW